MEGGLGGSPLQPLPRLTSLAVWLGALLQGIARGRWSAGQARAPLTATLLALALLDEDDRAGLPPLARAGLGAVVLWRVRSCAIRARVSPREIAAATRFLDSLETWVARLGEDRLNEIWEPLWPALAERLALRPPVRAARPQTP
eukprot:9884767-Alexandrium_andersonii.AAC.1